MLNRRKYGTYICIEGLDGSGKSTLFKNIVVRLTEKKIKFTTACPTRMLNQNNLVERLFRQNSYLNSSRNWRALLYAYRSNSNFFAINWKNPLILGDRSIITSYVTRWRHFMKSAKVTELLVNFLEPLIFTPDHVLFLELPLEILRQRLSLRGEPLTIDETTERLESMRHAYNEIKNSPMIHRLQNVKWHVLDSQTSPDSLTNQAWEIMEKIIPDISNLSK